MKKVAVIWSSPNKDGLTASTKDRYIECLTQLECGLKQAGDMPKYLRPDSICITDNKWAACS